MAQNVRQTMERKQGLLAEAVANTLKYENVEVPGSAGALAVELIAAQVRVTPPTLPPGANGEAYVAGGVGVGKLTPTVVTIADPGMVEVCIWMKQSAGAGVPATNMMSFQDFQGPGILIPKDPGDGKFYFTNVVISAGDAALQSMQYNLWFRVYK